MKSVLILFLMSLLSLSVYAQYDEYSDEYGTDILSDEGSLESELYPSSDDYYLMEDIERQEDMERQEEAPYPEEGEFYDESMGVENQFE